jgi:Cys-rich four helix bundle protein (predicted Tat secretion target)
LLLLEVVMSNETRIGRRQVVTGLAGVGAALAAASARAQTGADPHAGHVMNDAPAAPGLSGAHRAVVDSTADCLRTGRVCLARCTDHFASGMKEMVDCQRAVMNMLAVVAAMADVAGYANAAPRNLRSLALTCAEFCTACADACDPHAARHEECRACRDACLDCAKACKALAAA